MNILFQHFWLLCGLWVGLGNSFRWQHAVAYKIAVTLLLAGSVSSLCRFDQWPP